MPIKNYIGEIFGFVEVLEKTDKRKNGYIVYKCKCHKCGKIISKTLGHLSRRKKQGFNNMTCGCYDRKHNHLYKNGLSNTRLRYIYAGMKARCYNKNNPSYKNYGERGIKICDEWKNNFETFYNWAIKNGYNENLTIERINNNGNYEPNNCKWATMLEQVRNRRNTILITYNNKTQSIKEWAKEYNIELVTLRTRINRGWEIGRALKEKTHSNCKRKKLS